MGKKMPAEEDPKRSDFKSKADIVAFVKKAFEDGASVIKNRMAITDASQLGYTPRTSPRRWSAIPLT